MNQSDKDLPSHDAAEFANDDVQADIASLLRASAHSSNSDLKMPDEVAARIRGALTQEMSARAGSSVTTTPTVVPLPRKAAHRIAEADTAEAAAVPMYQRDVPRETSAGSASDAGLKGNIPQPDARPSGSQVASLNEHRARRRSNKRMAGIGAAAATVVIAGSFGASQLVASGPSQDSTTTNFASKVRVTDSGRSYTSDSLTTEAASLTTSTGPTIKDTEAAQNKLGSLVTPEGLQKCIASLDETLAKNPKHVYADFGQYNGQRAVIVVVENTDGKKEVWVVKGTCTKADDKIDGPKTVTT